MQPALIIRRAAVMRDSALGSRGDRKLLVTAIRPQSERPADAVEWNPPEGAERCPVQVMPDTELAVFTGQAKQTRHRHLRGTEIYSVVDGTLRIEVEGTEYELRAGDTIVVNAGAFHEVKRDGEFLCQVIGVNCGGESDRFDA